MLLNEAYVDYEAKADAGKIRTLSELPAVSLWRKMLGMIFETGHPWITFKDPCNLRSPQHHVGVIHSSNLALKSPLILLLMKLLFATWDVLIWRSI